MIKRTRLELLNRNTIASLKMFLQYANLAVIERLSLFSVFLTKLVIVLSNNTSQKKQLEMNNKEIPIPNRHTRTRVLSYAYTRIAIRVCAYRLRMRSSLISEWYYRCTRPSSICSVEFDWLGT